MSATCGYVCVRACARKCNSLTARTKFYFSRVARRVSYVVWNAFNAPAADGRTFIGRILFVFKRRGLFSISFSPFSASNFGRKAHGVPFNNSQNWFPRVTVISFSLRFIELCLAKLVLKLLYFRAEGSSLINVQMTLTKLRRGKNLHLLKTDILGD